jgi:hypothetical protein
VSFFKFQNPFLELQILCRVVLHKAFAFDARSLPNIMIERLDCR